MRQRREWIDVPRECTEVKCFEICELEYQGADGLWQKWHEPVKMTTGRQVLNAYALRELNTAYTIEEIVGITEKQKTQKIVNYLELGYKVYGIRHREFYTNKKPKWYKCYVIKPIRR